MQATQHVLMIRPARFDCNPQTAGSNAFQHPATDAVTAQIAALTEFDAYVEQLRSAGVDVLVEQDDDEPHTPDSIFPNNWVSFHDDGTVVLYPMEAANRRLERKQSILARIAARFEVRRTIDLSHFERLGQYLEGTGSMILDREHRVAYICRSSRSHRQVMNDFATRMNYRAVWFNAFDMEGRAIYHTNVMMSVGRTLAVVCLEAIRDAEESAELEATLQATGKEILDISLAQILAFACNVLELQGAAGEPLLAMSRRAWRALSASQQAQLRRHVTPVVAALDTIETLGGGGARCMIAEIHLPLRATP